jgi:deazaflavin-dependent oxidoreductase (nitroreductase family)
MDQGRSPDRLWPILRPLIQLHVLAYRATRGRFGHRMRGTPPMLLLEHIGANSGVRRTAPLGYIRDGENLVVVASKGGHPRNPSWFHNLRAHPDVTVQVGATRSPVRACVAQPAERERLWPAVLEAYGGYGDYQRRTSREIPLVILEPRGSAVPARAPAHDVR